MSGDEAWPGIIPNVRTNKKIISLCCRVETGTGQTVDTKLCLKYDGMLRHYHQSLSERSTTCMRKKVGIDL